MCPMEHLLFLRPLRSCGSKIIAECFVDPCSVNSCPADPAATCLVSYCGFNGSYHGQPVRPCEAVYVDTAGNRVNCSSSQASNDIST